MIYSVDVRVTAPVNDTEVPERVGRAVENVFPSADIEIGSDRVTAEGHEVEQFRDRLREQRILDTSRGTLLGARQDDTLAFALKKQAAFEGVVNFAVGNPDELGDIEVEIRVHEPSVEEFIDYLAPPTDEAGEPVDATE